MIPSSRFLGLLAAGFLPLLAAVGDPFFWVVGIAWDGGLILLAVVDALMVVPRRSGIEAERSVPKVAPLGRELEVELVLRNLSTMTVEVAWRDLPPASFKAAVRSGRVVLPPRSEARRSYEVSPLARADHELGDLALRWRSRLGLVWRQRRAGLASRVRVHPDPSPRTREEALAMRAARGGPTGMRLALIRGEGREFESLREYRPDDEIRRIDWKATARRGRLIVREYEAERDQRVMILLDCGRAMGVRVDDLTRLDRLVEAALRLGRVALDAGDRVGLVAFSGRVRRALPPGKGRTQLRRLAEVLTELEADATEPDYEAAFARLRSLVGRRALVVVLTELAEEEAARPLLAAVRSAIPRHLCVVLSLEDRSLAEAALLEPHSPRDAYRLAVARRLEDERLRLRRLLRAQGAHAAEVAPQEVTLAAVERYLDVKARGLL